MGWPEVVISVAGILGTLGGTFAGIRAERRRWEQEQRSRFHPDRYAKYTQLLQDADKVMRRHLDVQEVDKLFVAMSESYAHIQMLSSKPVREAAEAFYSISQAVGFRELGEPGSVSREERATRVAPAREAFVAAARKELRITSEDLM